jgi:hypothetical protein
MHGSKRLSTSEALPARPSALCAGALEETDAIGLDE